MFNCNRTVASILCWTFHLVGNYDIQFLQVEDQENGPSNIQNGGI